MAKKDSKKKDKKDKTGKKKLLKLKLRKKKEKDQGKKGAKKKVAKKKDSKKKEGKKKGAGKKTEKKKGSGKKEPKQAMPDPPAAVRAEALIPERPVDVQVEDRSANYNVKEAILKLRAFKSWEEVLSFTRGETRITVTKVLPSVQRRLAG